MKATEFYHRFIAVHKCAGCGEILHWRLSKQAFCPKCQLDWNADTLDGCPECFLPARECECMPKSLEKAGALTHRKLVFYVNSQEHKASNGIIYWLKHLKNTRIARFVAKELLPALNNELKALEINNEEAIITYVPRGKRAKLMHGFDQAQMVCKQLSILTNIPHTAAFRSSISRKQQKDLDSRARIRHANSTIRIRDTADVSGKYVVLFDDIVTSGASMAVCTRQLMKKGAKGVICLSLASRQKSKR